MTRRDQRIRRRLNVLLRLPYRSLPVKWKTLTSKVKVLTEGKWESRKRRRVSLDDAGWSALLDDLAFAVFDQDSRMVRDDVFHHAASLASVRTVQHGLRGFVQGLYPEQQDAQGERDESEIPPPGAPSLPLGPQEVFLRVDPDGHFRSSFVATGFDDGSALATMVYMAFAYLIERANVRAGDFAMCDNPRCRMVFLPLRRPHAGKPTYCSVKCGNLVAASRYRESQREKIRKKDVKQYDDAHPTGAAVRRKRRDMRRRKP